MKAMISLLVLFGCSQALGHANFVSNPYLPYPPACAGIPGNALSEPTERVEFDQYDEYGQKSITMYAQAYRQACSEPGRSLIWIRISTAPEHRDQSFSVALPEAWVNVTGAEWAFLMRLVTTPDGWGSNSDFNFHQIRLENWPTGNIAQGTAIPVWTFLLDDASWNVYNFPSLSATQYNGSLDIRLQTDSGAVTIQIPATSDLLEPEKGLPLSGRLSGMWVMDGAVDQGVSLSISNRIETAETEGTLRDALPLVVFLAQYTYGSEGELLWLTGSADFSDFAEHVTIPMVRVDRGEFMGTHAADREVIGTVTITANNCDDLTFDYDYSKLGLGAGSRRMRRLYSLETAGYDCRDYEARVQANR